MTDLHTHILPDMDDGAKNVSISLAMLQAERDSGVDTVALTPHLYRGWEEPGHFLQRRERAYASLLEHLDTLPPEDRNTLPRMILGAEVAWAPNLASWSCLKELCYEGSNFLLVEMPFQRPWTQSMLYELYDLMGKTGIVPVIAHIERYLNAQKKNLVEELLSMGLPVQISAEALLAPFRKGNAVKLLRSGAAHFLISDCHNVTSRPPNLGKAATVLRHKLGKEEAAAILRQADQFLPSRKISS